MLFIFLLLLSTICIAFSRTIIDSSLTVHSNDSNLKFEGRYDVIDENIVFDHPGFKITVNVTGTRNAAILLSAVVVVPNRFWIYINGKLSDFVIDTNSMANNTITKFVLASDLNPSLSNTISVLKITEAQWNSLVPEPNYISFEGFVFDLNATTLPLKNQDRRIEFIGDSIQAGFCDMCSTVDTSFGDYAKESFGAAHPYLTCESLNASCHTAAWSGYGVVRNCCGGDTLMPEIYSRTLGSVPGSQWTPSRWLPDAVVVNLGDNDGLDRFDPTGDLQVSFVETYTEFIRGIAKSYKASNPTFFLCCGPMSFGYCSYVQQAMSQLKAEGVPVSYVEFPPIADPNKKCCGHPSSQGQAQMAAQLTAQIASIMEW